MPVLAALPVLRESRQLISNSQHSLEQSTASQVAGVIGPAAIRETLQVIACETPDFGGLIHALGLGWKWVGSSFLFFNLSLMFQAFAIVGCDGLFAANHS